MRTGSLFCYRCALLGEAVPVVAEPQSRWNGNVNGAIGVLQQAGPDRTDLHVCCSRCGRPPQRVRS